MVLEAIFNLIGAIFLNEMDLLAVRRLFQSETMHSRSPEGAPMREGLPSVMESLLKKLALLFTSGPFA